MKLLLDLPASRLFLTDDGLLVSERTADTDLTSQTIENFARLIDDIGGPRGLLIRRVEASYAFEPDGYVATLELLTPRLSAVAVVTPGGARETATHREAALIPSLPIRAFQDEAAAFAWLRANVARG